MSEYVGITGLNNAIADLSDLWEIGKYANEITIFGRIEPVQTFLSWMNEDNHLQYSGFLPERNDDLLVEGYVGVYRGCRVKGFLASLESTPNDRLWVQSTDGIIEVFV